MEVLGIVVVIAVLIGVSALVSHIRSQATKALNRNVFSRDKHNRGQATIREVIEFAAPVPAQHVLDSVRSSLALPTVAPAAFVAALHLIESRPGALVFGFGNRLSQTFRSALLAEDLPTGGSHATYRVLNWVEGDGIVRGIAEMELLANTVRGVAAALGATYGSVPPAVAPRDPSLAATGAQSLPHQPRACPTCGSTELGERFCTDCGAIVA